jgi:hypothetical protein
VHVPRVGSRLQSLVAPARSPVFRITSAFLTDRVEKKSKTCPSHRRCSRDCTQTESVFHRVIAVRRPASLSKEHRGEVYGFGQVRDSLFIRRSLG